MHIFIDHFNWHINIDNIKTPKAVITKSGTGKISWTGRKGTKLGIFMIGGGGSSYQEGGGGSGNIEYVAYTTITQRADIHFEVGKGGFYKCWGDLGMQKEGGECRSAEKGRDTSVSFPGGNKFIAPGGAGGGIDGDAGGAGWSGGGGDDGGKGGSNGGDGTEGKDGRGGYGSDRELPEMKRFTLSPGDGGRGGTSKFEDGGGGGGVLVDGKGPPIRRDKYDHESGQGYGAGGSHGCCKYGVHVAGTDGLIVVEVIPGKVLCTSVFY
jgi:hypothetical protein